MMSTECLALLKGIMLVRKESVILRQKWNDLESQKN